MITAQHIAYGRHSNIPERCIQFFVGEWLKIWPAVTAYERDRDVTVQYVRCPACLASNYSQPIHACKGCTDEERGIT